MRGYIFLPSEIQAAKHRLPTTNFQNNKHLFGLSARTDRTLPFVVGRVVKRTKIVTHKANFV